MQSINLVKVTVAVFLFLKEQVKMLIICLLIIYINELIVYLSSFFKGKINFLTKKNNYA